MSSSRNWGDPKHFHMFSQHRLDLHQEVAKHPVLLELLQKHPQEEFEILLAEIACYCEVMLDGDYTPTDLDNICKICYERLVLKRTGIKFARKPDSYYDETGGW